MTDVVVGLFMSFDASIRRPAGVNPRNASPAAEPVVHLACDPAFEERRITTESLTEGVYARLFGEASSSRQMIDVVRARAAAAGAAIPAPVFAAAQTVPLEVEVGRMSVRSVWERPSLYLRIEIEESFVVLRIESHPRRRGVRAAWVHEIDAAADKACEMLDGLSASWSSIETRAAARRRRIAA